MTKLEELRTAYEGATQEQAASLEAGVAMQAKLLDFGELAHNLMPTLLEAVGFVAQVSRYLQDGEADDFGEEFVMENDDAVDTLHLTISDARHILEKLS